MNLPVRHNRGVPIETHGLVGHGAAGDAQDDLNDGQHNLERDGGLRGTFKY